MADAKIPPAVNQIYCGPEFYAANLALVEYCSKHNIVIQAYSPLNPLRDANAEPVAKAVAGIARERTVPPENVLLAWYKAKGCVQVG